jgi:hypothetical protein
MGSNSVVFKPARRQNFFWLRSTIVNNKLERFLLGYILAIILYSDRLLAGITTLSIKGFYVTLSISDTQHK